MRERKTPRRPAGRTVVIAHYFTPEEIGELCRCCGILIADVDTTPTKDELRDAARELVREALAARLARRARQARQQSG